MWPSLECTGTTWAAVVPLTQNSSRDNVCDEKIHRWRQDSLEGVINSCLLRQKMDPECARIDQLCLRAAEAERRAVSEFSSFLSQN